MKFTSFIRKYNGYGIQDYCSEKSPEFIRFCRDFKAAIDTEFPDCEIDIHMGHYDVSGFISKEEKYVYIDYSVPRQGYPMDFTRRDALGGVLYRTAASTKDFKGGTNRFSSMKTLPENIQTLLR